MARKKGPTAPLPHVQVAAFCEHMLDEKDNVQSAIRIVDTFSVAEPPATSGDESPHALSLRALLMFKAGQVKGSRTVRIEKVDPGGEREEAASTVAFFEGEERGVVIRLTIGDVLAGAGLYWLDVFVEDTLLTRMPFRIVYQRPSTTRSEAGA